MSINAQRNYNDEKIPTDEELKQPEKEIIRVPFTCAEVSLPFQGIYKLNSSGIYEQQKLERLAPFGDPSETCDNVAMLDINNLGIDEFICPWCQNDASEGHFFIRCGTCGTLNCPSCYTLIDEDKKLYDFECSGCERKECSISFGLIETIAVGDGGLSGSLDGSVKKITSGQI